MGTNYFNWVEDNTHKANTTEARKVLAEVKSKRYNGGKKYRLVPVPGSKPTTYIEEEIK